MRLHLLAVGHAKAGPEKTLFDDYATRIRQTGTRVALGPLTLIEVESRKRLDGAGLAQAEAALLRAARPPGAALIALDERGQSLGSEAFAARLARHRDQGAQDLAFIIGGHGGLDPALRGEADWSLALGPLTWPHMLVRVLIAEQIYRAVTILAGHPYHRA